MGKQIGKLLKEYREKHKIKKEKLALDLGISVSYLNALETGQRDSVSSDCLIKIAGHLKVSTDDLLGLKTPKK